jgi:hypothetical protein
VPKPVFQRRGANPSHKLHQDIEVSRQITLWGGIPIGAASQYGAHAFSKEVLAVCQTATELAETENELIEGEGCLSSGGMNRWAAALAARELGFGRALSRVRPMPEPSRVDIDRRTDHPIERA